ncbi:DUF1659 domain-containing protein [Fictibacillus fluitans]|jgi:hypothetical protein|uniref:DUF1659 domain-containing protein n=1 Tax=Fictibacillus fluitans TaxID=3058422 RepID=A0ABT8HVQ6_9BACL|nr:DUF1659 domain-containing protein [Fictibacillus sp. NE201]MDN4524862.1 DUF1659 domain-containing protein [Fictibacillus sp. NE201]
MATTAILNTQLRLVFDGGMDGDKQIYKNKNFSNVKTGATAEQLYAVANALAPLQQLSLLSVERNDSYSIYA